MTATIRVAELFGPTFQGEGRNAGRRAAFVRLVDCNLDCAWCDTPYTWDWSGKNGTRYIRLNEYTPRTPDEVLAAIAPMNVDRVVVTGGEPLLRMEQFLTLARALHLDGYSVEVETNGTILPVPEAWPLVDQWNVSPKLRSARTTLPSIVPDVLTRFAPHLGVDYKFVVADQADLDEVTELVDLYHLPKYRVWLMPEGTTVDRQVASIPWVADAAIAAGFQFTTRLHTLAWGNSRGR